MRIAVVGGGSWGTALARLLALKGHDLWLWMRDPRRCQEIARRRENPLYLPRVTLPEGVHPTTAPEAVGEAELVICALPSHAVREVFAELPLRGDAPVVSASKGLIEGRGHTVCEVLEEFVGRDRLACLSGPSFAQEVARDLPTALCLAAHEEALGRELQGLLATPRFRIYTSRDVRGVELGGALKNVMAIAAGISDGLGLGHNTRAALICRSLVEMTRLGVRLGARPETFAGLAGLGDLTLSCTSDLSRNRRFGLELGRGGSPEEALAAVRGVVEGWRTAGVVHRLAGELGVEMPIAEQVYEVIYRGKPPWRAVEELLARQLKEEAPW